MSFDVFIHISMQRLGKEGIKENCVLQMRKIYRLVPLGADKTHDCKYEAHFIETYCKKKTIFSTIWFQYINTSWFHPRQWSPRLFSFELRSNSWGGRQGWRNASRIGHISIYHVGSIVTSKQIELEKPGCSGFEENSSKFVTWAAGTLEVVYIWTQPFRICH